MTIQTKLFAMFGAICVLALIAVGLGVYTSHTLTNSIVNLSQNSEDATYFAGQIDTVTSDMQAEQRGMLMRVYRNEPGEAQKLADANVASIASLHKFVSSYRPLAPNPDAVEKVSLISDRVATIDQLNPGFLEAIKAGNAEKANQILGGGLASATDNASTAGADLLDLQQQLAHEEGLARVKEGERSNWIMLSLFLPICLVGIFLAFVVRNLSTVLRQTILDLAQGSEQIISAAGQVSASSQSLAQGASEQTATIEETSAASSEINQTAKRTNEHSNQAAQIVTRSQSSFANVNSALSGMVVAMDEITSSSSKISKIIKVIDEIAFQTNILALNAAVEAARAGEAGMGFGVVADEVRSLAQRCAAAARDTTVLIEDSVVKSNGGRAKVSEVSAAIETITGESMKIRDLVDEIRAGSLEQANGIEQIRRAIAQMEMVTQSSAATSEESAAAAAELHSQAESLGDTVEALRGLVDGGSRPAAPSGLRVRPAFSVATS